MLSAVLGFGRSVQTEAMLQCWPRPQDPAPAFLPHTAAALPYFCKKGLPAAGAHQVGTSRAATQSPLAFGVASSMPPFLSDTAAVLPCRLITLSAAGRRHRSCIPKPSAVGAASSAPTSDCNQVWLLAVIPPPCALLNPQLLHGVHLQLSDVPTRAACRLPTLCGCHCCAPGPHLLC